MKKISDHTQLVVGGIYNSIYTGSNEAYARINGKATFQVMCKNPLEIENLHDQFGSAFSEEMRSNRITITSPQKAFEEYELYECESTNDWFIKAIRVSSLDEALRQGLPLDMLNGKTLRRRFIVSMGGPKGSLFGLTYDFRVEDKTPHQFLQSIVVLWKTWNEMEEDVKKHDALIER